MFNNPISVQIKYQLKRQFKIKFHEKLNLTISFVVAPLLSVLSAYIFRSNMDLVQNQAYPNYLFFMLISAIFFGLISSVFEIIKDRNTVQRERLGGVSIFGYYVSKYYVLSFFGLIQTILYNLIGMIFLSIPWAIVAFNSLVMFLTIVVSISFGLFISSFTRSNMIASNLIPIIIIPQILLGGLIPYADMDRAIYMWETNYSAAPPLARVMPIKYAYESIITGNVAFTLGNNEINDQISQMVDFLQDDQFMSITKQNILENLHCSFCSQTWFLDIIIIIGYIIGTFILGYIIFYRRIFNG
ncbi:MAG: ABC transporter permease [Sulfurimonas sp.]